ncbi:amidohydrolase family protein [Alienimonas californiensis]|uniref:Adenosine deaminase n=1 Tax=Alienimonas californiensis TaxID=2527989 RepID=A0A517PDP2_9PLAN|nr:amidohydrolase family protein [Alienimonas californiensis]QDT17486.1 Adenosine deaminase [Alienimonas californiensis]
MSAPDAPPAALTARWVLPVEGPPIHGGTVELTPDGRVAAVHDRPDARSGAEDLGELTLLPGFVNCHTHLEFSDFTAPLPAAGTFADWIAATVAARRDRPGDRMERVNRGLAECLAAGVTTVGEIATGTPEQGGWDAARLPPPHARPALVAFGELIAPRDPVAGLAAARAFLHGDADPPDLIRGLSPHAPYSVHPAVPTLLAACPDTAAAPWAIHLLETDEEIDLMAQNRGPLAAAMARLGATRGDFGANRLRRDYLDPLAAAARGLVIHGNRQTKADVEWLSAPERWQLSVIYCPRTHAHFRHPPHPWLALREAGVRVALGTDGRGSNPDLSVLGELQFLHAQFPAVPTGELLALGTLHGAEAMGVHGGRIAANRPADLCGIRPGVMTNDPAADVLHPVSAVAAVWRAGRRVR